MIRHLRPDDAEVYVAIRHRALLEVPLAFASSPQDDSACSVDAVRQRLAKGAPDSIIVGAFDPDLIGTLGLYRDSHIKAAHKVHLWGMYVAPSHRRRGIGEQLMETAIRHARSLAGVSIVRLSVSSAMPGAQRLYERAGFRVWGAEPDALRHKGESVTEHHMILKLT